MGTSTRRLDSIHSCRVCLMLTPSPHPAHQTTLQQLPLPAVTSLPFAPDLACSVMQASAATPLAKKTVQWNSLVTVFSFSRQLACDKLPSDAVAPLGLGKLLDVAHRRLDARMQSSTRGWLMPVPPE